MAPLQSSPTAQAFFTALDGKSSESSARSSFISKKIKTLGWRNRYSQEELYPIDIETPDGRSKRFHVRQVQRGELEGTYGTGATVWPASIVLLKYLERHAEALIKSKYIVDLGAGTGITSIGVALLGASRVVCTDGEFKVVQLAHDNIERAVQELDGSTSVSQSTAPAPEATLLPLEAEPFLIESCPVRAQQYWWGSGTIDDGACCDVVLVSDCVLPKLYPIAPLVDALDQLLVKAEAVAILSYEHRFYPEYDPRDKFRELSALRGLAVELVPNDEHHQVYSTDDIEIWRVQRNTS